MARWSTHALLLAAIVTGALIGCVKPPPVGYVVPGPQKPGKVLVGLQGGGGVGPGEFSDVSAAGGGALQLEPFATRRLSFPITLAVLGGHGMNADDGRGIARVWGQLRTGLRYRVGNHWFVGGGLDTSVVWRTQCADNGYEEDICSGGVVGIFGLDFEWGYSQRWKRFGLTYAQRLTWDATLLHALHAAQELTLAFHGKSDSWAFTVSVGIGFTTIPYPVWGSAAVGLVFNL